MAKAKPRKPRSKAKPAKPKHPLRCGLVYRPGPPWKVDVTNFRDFREAIGDELLVAFCRAFNVTYKLASLVDLIGMNWDTAVNEPTRFDRNMHALGLFSLGVSRELPDVITEMRRAGIEKFLSKAGVQRWVRLQKFETFGHPKVIKHVRDELAFHAGSAATIRRGIEKLGAQKHALAHVLQGDVIPGREHSRRNQVRADLGLEMLFTALAIDGKDLKAAYTEIRDAHLTTLRVTYQLFLDVMRTKGADLVPLQSEEEEEAEVQAERDDE